MGAGGEKFPQARRGLQDGIGPDDGSNGKAARARSGDQFLLKRGEI
jgi:hypothetical protein